MTAERAVVIPFEPRRGRPSRTTLAGLQERVDEARMELMARRLEAIEHVDTLDPLVRRLEFMAMSVGGPIAMHTVGELQRAVASYRRRWDSPTDAA